MNEYTIATGTVTSAIKGREILKRKGIYAEIERMKATEKQYGCGYSIAVRGNINEIETALKQANVKILKILPR
ncbi:MAG: putative Se/S carrier-like protein [Acutalibacteraceae bacterium]|nr:putative Se/S carrier-like protein [Acutalibacteraceae bacterium]